MSDLVSMKEDKIRVVLISGLSGAGKTHAADWFEDRGYYCIDNMPPALIRNFIELTYYGGSSITRAAFVVDIRSDEFLRDISGLLQYLRENEMVDLTMLYLEASDDTLVKRYNETRRSHPMTNGPATRDVIERERRILDPFRRQADVVIDTTSLKVAAFNAEMEHMFTSDPETQTKFALNLMSFGYKYGVPEETDVTFDMRFIPNPFYVPSLRKLTGNNKKVRRYVLKQEVSRRFIQQIDSLVGMLAPCYMKEGKYHLNIAFGCTGGQHRSVVMANEMARIFREEGYRVTLRHREMKR